MPDDTPKKKRPSLADVAKIAGVHKITASRVMRGVDKVSEKTRKKVLAAADQLGYKHSAIVSTVMGHLARTRKSEHSTPIALVIDRPYRDTNHSVITKDMLTRAQARADMMGFKVELFPLFVDGMNAERLNSILIARGIKGVILNVASPEMASIELEWDKFTIVTSGGRMDKCRQLPSVRSDAPQIINRATREALKRDYKRIGYCFYKDVGKALGGLTEAAMRYHQSNYEECKDIPPLDTLKQPPEVFLKWLKTYQPDVIISQGPFEMKWLRQSGYKIPEDIGYVNFALSDKDMEAGTSGLRQYKGDLTAAALELVVNNMLYGRFGPQDKPARMLLPGEWIEGTTVRPF